MKINITKKEYRLLLDMLYIGEWIINARAENKKECHTEYQALKKKFLSYYKEMGADDIVEFSKDLGDYFELDEYGFSLNKRFIDVHDRECFGIN